MQTSDGRPVVKIAPNNPVFDLPVIVGIEEGLFAKGGLDVSFSATYAEREKDDAQTPFMARLKENLFEIGLTLTFFLLRQITLLVFITLFRALTTYDDAEQIQG